MTPTITRRLLGAVAACALLAGCTSGGAEEASGPHRPGAASSTHDESPSSAPAYHRYVALGDSFTAGPYVPDTQLAGGCLRSDANYPALVAERLEIRTLVDVSCSGASTRDLVRRQTTFRDTTVPPQLDAVTKDTDLVTIGIGGNDFDLFGTLLSTCARLWDDDPTGSPCADSLEANGFDLERQVRQIGERVATAIERVRARAPRAEILLVGYPRIAPTAGTCEALLPLAEGDYRLADAVTRDLHAAMQRAARRTGVEFVGMYPASEGHDVCSDEAWVNGRITDETRALAFHPFSTGMEAVADRVVERLS